MNNIADRLAENNLKITQQRKIILDILAEASGQHLTADDVYLEVKKVMPGIGLATVYRTLELLARLDIIHKSSFDEGKYRYEICEDTGHYHHHFICLTCGGITEVKDDLLHHLEADMESKGFKVVDHTLKIYGNCPTCQQCVAAEEGSTHE
ncbi:MAG: Fur family transcriptional regulator [Ignavibacteriales bacterium]